MIFSNQFIRSKKSKQFISLICFVFLISYTSAQTGVVNNGAKLIVNSGAILKITGTGADYTNTTSGGYNGRIDLDGKIELEGDWTNNAISGFVLTPINSDGIVLFNGSTQQSISGTSATGFENLSINNTSGLSLSANIGVRNVLTLSNGLVTLNSSNITLSTFGSLSGTFGTTKMFVTNGTGELRKSYSSTGTFTFPIGENTGTIEYSPVSFNLTSGSFSSAWVGARVTDAKHPENTSPDEYLTRYWTLSSSGIASPKYNAAFTYLDADIIGTEADIYAAEYDGATRSLYGTVNSASNLLTVTALSNFADYTGVDGTAPTTVITTTEPDPTNSNPIPFKVTFSESVNGFVSGDIAVSNGTVADFVSTANPEFTFNVTPTGQGEVTVNVAGGVATDDAGNNNTVASQYSIIYDSTSPTVTVASSEPDPTNNTFAINITFSEEVNNFHVEDITVGNGSASNFYSSDSTVFTANITPTTDGTVTVDINSDVVIDNAGNGNTAATQFSITYDDNSPTVAITTSESDPTNANPIQITITFNEVVSGFALSDLVVIGGSPGNLQTVTANRIWTADIIPSGNGTITADLSANQAYDAAGNGNTAASQFSIDYDGTKPTVIISTLESDPTNASPFAITVTFNEDVSGFDITDISVGNGSASGLSNPTPNRVWTANITPSVAGTVTVDIAIDAATDAAANGNTAADQFSITFDDQNPTVLSFTPADDETGVSINSNLDINFSEDVNVGTGFIRLFNSSNTEIETFNVESQISGDGTSTITVNPSDFASGASYYVKIDATAFDDDAGNSFAGFSDNATWNFTAADVSKPYITLRSPLDNAIDVSVSSDLIITFSEIVNAVAGKYVNIVNETTSAVESIEATNTSYITISNELVTINPTDFDGETGYHILIDNGAFEDVENNGFLGISSNTTWNFITEDITAPTISSTTPADEDGDVAINSNLIIAFDEDVAKGSGNIIITNATTASEHESIDVLSGQVTISSNVVTIDPSIDFDGESDYYVEMASGVFTDASSNTNDFAGIAGSTTWNFSSEDKSNPTVILSTTEASPTNSPTFSVTITFSEYVNNLLVGDISVTNGNASNLQTIDNWVYTVDISPTVEDTVIVEVPAGVAQDNSTNANNNEISNTLKLYYDVTSPNVVITGPTGPVAGDFDVTVTFNEGITDLLSGNITVGGGTVNNVTNLITDTAWTVTITPTIDGTVTVDVDADAVVDIAGNGNAASNTFSIEYDGTGPVINTLYPSNGASDVPISENLVITFDENVDYNTTFYVNIYQLGGSLVEQIDVSTLSGYGTNEITIDPSDFAGETTYYVLIDPGAFRDDLFNDFAGITLNTDWVFTTADVDPPIYSTLSPTDGASDILVGTNLQITFNENISKNIGEITIINADEDLEHEVIDVSTAQVSVSTNVATIDPSIDLESQVNYYVLVGQGTFQDAAGNNFDGISLETDWNFMTEDLNPPVISSLLPADNGTGVSLTTDLEITFDENVVVNTGNITIMNATTASVHETIDVTTAQVDVTSNILTINPSIDFEESNIYYVSIPSGVISDDIGNDFGGFTDSETWNFTTGDFTAPGYSLLSPANNDNDVSYISDLVITFDEEINKGSGNITIYDVTAGTTHEIINVLSAQVGITTNVVTIDPSINFSSESQYYVLIDNGAFEDNAGNAFAGISSTSEWIFTVEDYVSPTLSSRSPLDDAIDVAVNSNLELTFSENISKGTGLISIINSTTSSTHESFDVSASNVTVSANTLTIDPTTDFEGMNDYYVQVASTAVKDASGNNYAGISGTTDWNFTTADASAPYVSAYSPSDNLLDVPVTSDLVLTFSENVVANTSGGNITIMNATNSSTHQTIDVLSGSVSVASNVVTINPNDFDGESDYYVLIDVGAFEDTEGNSYAGIASASTWNFTTEDITVPIITTITPKDDSVDVALNSDLEIIFSEDVFKSASGNVVIMNADNVTTHETIDITTGAVAIANNVVTIYPSVDFNEFTNYYVQIDNNSFVDGSGNSFAGIADQTSWNFRTVDNTVPTVLEFSPLDNAANVLVTANLAIKFSEDIAANTGNIVIMNQDLLSEHESIDITSANISVTDSTITINPTTDFAENTSYYVLVDDGAIQDLSGNSFTGIAGATTWNFATSDQTAPVITAMTPVDGSTNIAVDSSLQITFSENVVANTGLITIMNSTGTHESIDVLSAQVTITDNVVDISTSINFSEETDYYILIDNGAFHDLSGNSFAGIADQTTWNFRTIDATPPSLVTVSPIDGASNVSLNTDLQITFNESVEVNVGTVNIMNGSTIHESIDITSAQVTVASNTVTINPTTDLAEQTSYHVLVDSAAIQDISGNAFAGIKTDTEWNFTSADTTKPSVTISSVETGTVTGNFDITVTFSELVTGFESADITVTNATVGTFTETTTGLVWTITIEPIADGNVTIDVQANVAQDNAGNGNTVSNQFAITYDSGVGIDDLKPYDISIYSIGDRVIVEFFNENNYQFENGLIEVYNLIGQKIVDKTIDRFVRFETTVDHVSQIYVVKVFIDDDEYTKRLYVE